MAVTGNHLLPASVAAGFQGVSLGTRAKRTQKQRAFSPLAVRATGPISPHTRTT